MKRSILLFILAGSVCLLVQAENEAAASEEPAIKAVPTAGNAIRKRGTLYAEVQGFVVDRRTGAVGAGIEVREDAFDSDSHVASLVFSFPQLRYDRQTRQIMLGDAVVERRGIFRWWRNPDYRLTLKTREVESKESFGGSPSIIYDVYLVANDSPAKTVLAKKSRTGSSTAK